MVYPDYYYPSLVLLQSINRDGTNDDIRGKRPLPFPAWSKSSESSLVGKDSHTDSCQRMHLLTGGIRHDTSLSCTSMLAPQHRQ